MWSRSGRALTISSSNSLLPCCVRASAYAFAIANVSRVIPP